LDEYSRQEANQTWKDGGCETRPEYRVLGVFGDAKTAREGLRQIADDEAYTPYGHARIVKIETVEQFKSEWMERYRKRCDSTPCSEHAVSIPTITDQQFGYSI
jgi:hypothetical protein